MVRTKKACLTFRRSAVGDAFDFDEIWVSDGNQVGIVSNLLRIPALDESQPVKCDKKVAFFHMYFLPLEIIDLFAIIL